MALNTYPDDSVLKSSDVNEDFLGISNGSEMHYNAAWTTYTPGWYVNSGTTPAIGNGTLHGRYIQIGRLIFGRIFLKGGSTTGWGNGGNYWFSLPLPANTTGTHASDSVGIACGVAYLEDLATLAYFGHASLEIVGQSLRLIAWTTGGTYTGISGVNFNTPFTWGNGDFIAISFMYETSKDQVT